ncbi:sensor histidine kinase [Pullulanibacillus sp. KACC 23026]|uniref:sensor histidine kinase n=1 Tax=Pullulanibacillus sp. KACC 23026 TaxID=3028315 RepID=UPI0023AEEDC1|nr:sensor histidine kinase [Pullulanibacillus sp. KACC 23026]WEG13227.1 sensor histidine kinase [Pullulanibacillus sp. KACC 23026]
MEYQKRRRALLSASSILFVMAVDQLFIGPPLKILLSALIWLTYAGLLFIRNKSWTKKELVLAASLLVLETAAGLYWFHEIQLIYFLAIILFMASVQLSNPKSLIPLMAALFMAALLYLHFGRGDLFNLLSFLFFSIILYVSIRMRRQRNEMHELNKQQLNKLQEAYEQLQEASVTSMQYAVLEERTRIAREIHDAVGHSLTSLIVQMQALKYMIKKDTEEAAKSLEEMLVVARHGLSDIRTSVHSLAEDQMISGVMPLKALLSRMETSASIASHFHSELSDEDLTMNQSVILFKILQESITNIIRHSEATRVEVTLIKENGNIVLCISDNGLIRSNRTFKEGFGIRGMRARLEERGGKLHYSILEPNGFKLCAEIPEDL